MEDRRHPVVPSTQPVSPQPPPTPTFLGNTYDVLAIIGAAMAGVIALSCLTLNTFVYCLPLLPLLLGLIALINAQSSVNPQRTRLWGWVSVGVGGVVLLITIALIVLFIVFYGAIFASIFGSMPRQR